MTLLGISKPHRPRRTWLRPVARADTDDKPRMLFVTMSLNVGGTERQLAQIAPAIARLPVDVGIVSLLDRGTFAEGLEREGIRVSGPGPLAAPLPRSRAIRGLRLVSGIARLAWQLLRHRPQIVNFFLPLPFIIGAPLAALAGVPHILMSRRGLNTHFARYPGARTLERRLHPRVSLFVANSRAVARQLIDEEGAPANRVALIHNGIDLAPFDRPFDRDTARAELSIPSGALVMIMVANLHAYKGHGDLLHALSGMARHLRPDWTLLLAGRDGGMGSSLQALAGDLGIASHVRFLDQRSDVPSLLRLADLAVHCSHEEGSSNAVLEAMAAGLPLVVTDAGGNAEAVLDGVNGLVVPPRDPAALAAAILRIVKDPTLASRFGAAARQRVEAEYSLKVCLEKYERLYRALLAGVEPVAAMQLGMARGSRE
jgi:glycosyltransferase involved in cell wall biosynthesis